MPTHLIRITLRLAVAADDMLRKACTRSIPMKNGAKRPVYFWGRDYAMTEIVHCKSRNEFGVVAALQESTSLHFDRTMGVAAASVIIAVGKGRAFIRNRYTVPDTDMLAKRLIAGKERILFFSFRIPVALSPGHVLSPDFTR